MLIRPDASEEEVRQAVFVSAMDAFLPQLPDGLETVLGENAAGLAGRTCFAVTHRPAALELAGIQMAVTESGARCVQASRVMSGEPY